MSASSAEADDPGRDLRAADESSISSLRARADLLARARGFFSARGILEVETPLLGRSVVVERHIDPPRCRPRASGAAELLLQASPEAFMKRLLAAGSGPIYQITRAFREGELGALHNPEFTIVEWYRPGFDHERLMDEVDAWLRVLLEGRLDLPASERVAYAEVFEAELGVDPLEAGVDELREAAVARAVALPPGMEEASHDDWLDVLFSLHVQPRLGHRHPLFVHSWPASQAALARLSDRDPRVGERFELFVRGLELANGYHELADPGEQRRRFDEANRARVADGRDALPVDEKLLEALERGLPPCAGVAVGLDRVLLLATGRERLADVLAFPFDRL